METKRKSLISMLERLNYAGKKDGIEASIKRIYRAMQIALYKTIWGKTEMDKAAYEYGKILDALRICIEDLAEERRDFKFLILSKDSNHTLYESDYEFINEEEASIAAEDWVMERSADELIATKQVKYTKDEFLHNHDAITIGDMKLTEEYAKNNYDIAIDEGE